MRPIVRLRAAWLGAGLLVGLVCGCGGGGGSGGGDNGPPSVVGRWRFAQVTFTDGTQATPRARADGEIYLPRFDVTLQAGGQGTCEGVDPDSGIPWGFSGPWSLSGERLTITIERAAMDLNGDLHLTADEWTTGEQPTSYTGSVQFEGRDRLHVRLPDDVTSWTGIEQVLMQRAD